MHNHNNCFDLLRLVFALTVLFGHLIVISGLEELQSFSWLFNTYLAVTGFFVISGFLIAQSYDKSESLKLYFSKRCRRILPAYIAVVVGCAFGLSCMSSLPPDQYFFSKDWWQYLLANLSFLNFLHPSLPGVFENHFVNDASVNPSLWTLKIEAGFYLVLPLIIGWCKRTRRHWLPLLVLYVLAITYQFVLTECAEIYHLPKLAFFAHQLPGFISYFAVGIAAYLYKDWFLAHKNKMIIPAIIIFVSECYIIHSDILSPLCYGIIVLWSAFSLPKLNNVVRWGDISYSIYIYNGPILKVMLSLGLFEKLGTWMAIPLFLLIVLSVSLMSWNMLEKRFLNR